MCCFCIFKTAALVNGALHFLGARAISTRALNTVRVYPYTQITQSSWHTSRTTQTRSLSRETTYHMRYTARIKKNPNVASDADGLKHSLLFVTLIHSGVTQRPFVRVCDSPRVSRHKHRVSTQEPRTTWWKTYIRCWRGLFKRQLKENTPVWSHPCARPLWAKEQPLNAPNMNIL